MAGIQDKRKLFSTYRRQKDRLKMMAYELAVRCGVDVSMISISPACRFDSWPEETDEVSRIFGRYADLREPDSESRAEPSKCDPSKLAPPPLCPLKQLLGMNAYVDKRIRARRTPDERSKKSAPPVVNGDMVPAGLRKEPEPLWLGCDPKLFAKVLGVGNLDDSNIDVNLMPSRFFVSTQVSPDEGDGRYLLLKESGSGATSMEIKIIGIQDTELCIGTYYGWIALKNKDFQEAAHVRLSLLNTLSGARKDLPVVQATDVTQLFLFSDPMTPACVAVIVTDNGDYNLLLWTYRDMSWNRMLRITAQPADAFNVGRVNLITFGWHLFIGLEHANWIWELTKTGQSGQIHRMYRELPSPAADVTPHWTSHSKYLVESVGGGELWYVMICRHDHVAVSNSFVFRWHTANTTWSEVQRLDGVALLLDENRLIAVSADHETGFRDNCIYMANEPPAVVWRVYGRNDHSITDVCGMGLS